MSNIELYQAKEPLPEYYFTIERLMNQLFRLQRLNETDYKNCSVLDGLIVITWDAILEQIIENNGEIKSIS